MALDVVVVKHAKLTASTWNPSTAHAARFFAAHLTMSSTDEAAHQLATYVVRSVITSRV